MVRIVDVNKMLTEKILFLKSSMVFLLPSASPLPGYGKRPYFPLLFFEPFPKHLLPTTFYSAFYLHCFTGAFVVLIVSAHLGAREIFSMPSKTCPPNLNLPTVDNGQR